MVVLATAGDIPTLESLAASALLREAFPDLKMRFINVIDLLKLQPDTEHPHGLSDRDFDSLFTADKPVIFNFHGYPRLIHRLAYRRTNHANIHVRGYKEKGNINTPLELAINNQVDRFSIAMDVVDRVPTLEVIGAHAKEQFRNEPIDCCHYAYEHGIDKPAIVHGKAMRLGMGSDHAGCELKKPRGEYLRESGHAVVDWGFTTPMRQVDHALVPYGDERGTRCLQTSWRH